MLSLVLVLALGRWVQVYAAAALMSGRVGEREVFPICGNREIFLASVTVLPAVVLLLGAKGSFLAGTVLVGAAALGRYVAGKIGGMTGDTLGAISDVPADVVDFAGHPVTHIDHGGDSSALGQGLGFLHPGHRVKVAGEEDPGLIPPFPAGFPGPDQAVNQTELADVE